VHLRAFDRFGRSANAYHKKLKVIDGLSEYALDGAGQEDWRADNGKQNCNVVPDELKNCGVGTRSFQRGRARALRMRVTIIGSGDAFGSGGRFYTCFLVESAKGTLLLDYGASSPASF
jgi:hypothetical protein